MAEQVHTPTLKQLRYFEAVARHGHFGRAAVECAVTQPALSQQVMELESILGASLLERHKGGLLLTPAGRDVLARAKTMLAGTHDLMRAVRRQGAGKATQPCGTLQLGVIASVAPYLLPAALPACRALYPELDLRIRESVTETLVAELLDGRLDAVVMAAPHAHDKLAHKVLFNEPFYLAVPRHAGTARFGAAQLDDVDSKQLLLLEEGHCLRDQALAFCTVRTGVTQTLGASSLATIVGMVAANMGQTFLPAIAAASVCEGTDKIGLMQFTAPEPNRSIGIFWRATSGFVGDIDALGAVFAMAGRGLLQQASRLFA